MRVYVAGPIFTPEDRDRIHAAAARLRGSGHEPLIPLDADDPFPKEATRADVYRSNVDLVASADVLLALLEGVDADSGTAFEAGYAVARGIPVIGLRTDWRTLGDEGPVNLMLAEAADLLVHERLGLEAAWPAIEAYFAKPRTRRRETLVRDKVPAILRSEGKDARTRRVEGVEYARHLKRRIVQASQALLVANEAEERDEVADVLEALSALQDHRKWAPESLRRVKERRADELGGYRLGYVLHEGEEDGG